MKNNVIGNEGCVCSGGSLLFFRDLGGHACCKYLLFLTQNFTQSICQGGYKDFLMLYFSLRYNSISACYVCTVKCILSACFA